MQPNIDIIAEQMSLTKLGERNVEVTDYYPSPEEVTLIHKLPEGYDPEYDKLGGTNDDLKLMKRIHKFCSCPKHTKITPYLVEFKLCGDDACNLVWKLPVYY